MFFARKPTTISFEDGKHVLQALLSDVGERHWGDLVSRTSAASFGGMLGGMGSLNDLIICRANSHRISEDDEPRANTLLSAIIEICAETSGGKTMSGEDASRRCVNGLSVISGSRCLQCGHSFSGSRQVLGYLAAHRLHCVLSDGRTTGSPVARLLHYWHTREEQDEISGFIGRLETSGIEYAPGDGWMRPCRACRSDNTCVYRWSVAAGGLEPTSDNLKLQKHD
jgi:hypothetical protein